MRWPRSGPSQVPSSTTFSSGQLEAQSQSSRGRKAKGNAIDARIAWLVSKEPIPKVPAGSPSRSCEAAEPRSGGSAAATTLGRPCASTSNLQGMTKRCVPARSPATRRSCGRSRVTVKPIDTAHPGLNRGPCSRRSVRMRRMASSSGAALSRPSPAVNADGRSGSSSSMPTGAQASWKMLLSGSSSCVSVQSSHHIAAAITALAAPADAPVTAASSVWRGGVRR